MKSPTDVGTGKAKDEKAPLSEIIEVLNERFGTQLHRGGPVLLRADQGEGHARTSRSSRLRCANPLDKFQLGIRKLIEDLMIQRMAENDKIVTRYMADQEFQGSAFPILAREIFEAIQVRSSPTPS